MSFFSLKFPKLVLENGRESLGGLFKVVDIFSDYLYLLVLLITVCVSWRSSVFEMFMWVHLMCEEPWEGIKDLILDFEFFAEGLCWYLLAAFDFVADELLALCLVIVALVEEFIGFFFCKILIS